MKEKEKSTNKLSNEARRCWERGGSRDPATLREQTGTRWLEDLDAHDGYGKAWRVPQEPALPTLSNTDFGDQPR